MDHVPASLDDVLITAELGRRPVRATDYEAEARALTAVAEAMAASPQAILQKLVETALETCRSDSAGISILEPDGRHSVGLVLPAHSRDMPENECRVRRAPLVS